MRPVLINAASARETLLPPLNRDGCKLTTESQRSACVWDGRCSHHRSHFGSRSERGDAFAQPLFFRAFATWNGCAKSKRLVAGVGGATITVAILAQGLSEVMRSRNLSFLERAAPGQKTFFNKTEIEKANSTLRASRAVPHPSTDRAFRRLTSEFGWDRVYSTKYGRWRNHFFRTAHKSENHIGYLKFYLNLVLGHTTAPRDLKKCWPEGR